MIMGKNQQAFCQPRMGKENTHKKVDKISFIGTTNEPFKKRKETRTTLEPGIETKIALELAC